VQVIVHKVEAAEVDEMWSFVGRKSQQRWLWHAIDHYTGQVLAYVFGTREDYVFLELQALLEPFGITRFYTDGWGAYDRHIDNEKHTVGKRYTQKIERKHTTLRARIKRLVPRFRNNVMVFGPVLLPQWEALRWSLRSLSPKDVSHAWSPTEPPP